MNTFKTRDTAGYREDSPLHNGSSAAGRSLSLPTAGDLFFHFSVAMRAFQPLSFRRAEGWGGTAPDLSFERIVRLEGSRSFICVVRTQARLEKVLADSATKGPAAELPQWFDRLVLEMGRSLSRQMLGPQAGASVPLFLRPSTPRYWPVRQPEAVCGVWVGATAVEVRFWMAGPNREN
jgi:hypothetical protein